MRSDISIEVSASDMIRLEAIVVEGLAGGKAMIRQIELLAHRVGRALPSRLRKGRVLQSSFRMRSRIGRGGSERAAWVYRVRRGDCTQVLSFGGRDQGVCPGTVAASSFDHAYGPATLRDRKDQHVRKKAGHI